MPTLASDWAIVSLGIAVLGIV
eukprot:SAG31_NODE_13545_length_862_cov_1.495413_1_plen_21_part_01